MGQVWDVEKRAIDTLQTLIENAKIYDLVVYQDGDMPIRETSKGLLHENGTINSKGADLILIDYEEDSKGYVAEYDAEYVIGYLSDMAIFDLDLSGEEFMNATTAQMRQIYYWLKDELKASPKTLEYLYPQMLLLEVDNNPLKCHHIVASYATKFLAKGVGSLSEESIKEINMIFAKDETTYVNNLSLGHLMELALWDEKNVPALRNAIKNADICAYCGKEIVKPGDETVFCHQHYNIDGKIHLLNERVRGDVVNRYHLLCREHLEDMTKEEGGEDA